MKNIALILSYDGTNYHGWQTQKNGITIQQALTEAINQILKCDTYVSGVGRTDAGVHARKYVANFKAKCTIPPQRLPLAINAVLPEDITVLNAIEVNDDFDARFNCTKKEYAYYMYSSKINDPFLSKRAYRTTYPLDVYKMNEGAQFFVGTHDFSSVLSVGTPVKSTVRTIFHCQAEYVNNHNFVMQNDDTKLIRIRVCGDGFLYNMVRAISGTLMYVGSGKLKPEQIKEVLLSCDRASAGPTLPAHGLYMNRLWYDDTDELKSYKLDV